MNERETIMANPDNEYGWGKLYSERIAQAYGWKSGFGLKEGIRRTYTWIKAQVEASGFSAQ